MLSIQTNVNSLVAQQNLGVNSTFQSRTIQQLTSGYRINSSGDDAAGLAVANKFRSSVAELTQGVANGNDGVASLQIMDGGMNNIALMLDRLKTLAMQSASDSFTGGALGRSQLNSEFQTDIGEIDRQAKSIGLDTGGTFAKSLAVYLGAGSGSGTDAANSKVNVDLSKATVDSTSLGLTGVKTGNAGVTDLTTVNIATIVGDTTNSNTEAVTGTTVFKLYGPGFGNTTADAVDVSVNTTGVTDGTTLVAAINAGIATAGLSNSNFKNAGITASMTTDANSHQILTFSAADAAFQVRAGDRMANALLGNFTTTAGDGTALATTLAGAAYVGTFAAADPLYVRVEGAGLKGPVDLSVINSISGGASTTSDLIKAAVAANSQLAEAGITVSNTAGNLSFQSREGGSLKVSITGDTQNVLRFGSFLGTGETSSYIAGTSYVKAVADGSVYLDLSLAGGSSDQLTVTYTSANDTSAAAEVGFINAAIALKGNASPWQQAGIQAQLNGTSVQLVSTNLTAFRLGARNDGTDTSTFGFYGVAARNTATSLAAAYSAVASPGASFLAQDAKGGYQLGTMVGTTGTAVPLLFSAITFGTDKQAITVSAADSSGASHSVVVSLDQTNAKDIDQAIRQINTTIQNSNDTTLQNVTAVKVQGSGTEKIEFMSTLQNFSVNVGKTANGTGLYASSGSPQGGTFGSVKVGTGGAADISTLSGAQAAVAAITAAVGTLGTAQAAVGKGQNQLQYAVSLAQSEITNFAAAEAQIRDANVAQQAANLTKAQVLQQASIAAMAQANSAPQAVLTLLRG